MKIFIFFMVTLFSTTHHPISMITLLILITISTAIFTVSSMNNAWFSYIITLIMVGAMLIIFIYLASLAPNEIFPKLNLLPAIIPMIISIFSLKTMPSNPLSNYTLTAELFSPLPSLLTIFLASFLFVSMVAVVKMTSISEGPLKSI